MISEVSKRYARALFETIPQAEQAEVVAQLRALSAAIQADKTISIYFSSPMVTPEQRADVVRSLSGKINEKLLQFLLVLTAKKRLNHFIEIVASFENITDESQGVTRGAVRAASVLSDEQKAKIESVIANATKKKVILSYTEEPGLLGGLVAHVGGWTFDDSIATHLTQIGEELNRRSH